MKGEMGSYVCVCRDETQIHLQIDKKVAIFNFGWEIFIQTQKIEPVELDLF